MVRSALASWAYIAIRVLRPGGSTIRKRGPLLVVASFVLLLAAACGASEATTALAEPAATPTPTPQPAAAAPTPTLADHPATPPLAPERADSTPTPALTDPTATPAAAELEGGGTAADGAPDFHMVAYQGQDVLGADELDVSQLLGRAKPLVLNFWAGLCPPCRAEMAGFQRVYDDWGDRFLLVGVDIGPFTGLGSNDDARALLDELNISYPAAFATEDPVRSFAVLGMPTTLVFTADGILVAKRTGILLEAELREALQELIAPSS